MRDSWEVGKSISAADVCVSQPEMSFFAPISQHICITSGSTSQRDPGFVDEGYVDAVCSKAALLASQEAGINVDWKHVGFPELLVGEG